MNSISQKDIIKKSINQSLSRSYSQRLSEQVRRGIEAKREKIIEITVKRGQIEDALKDIAREMK